ncbi:Ammonium-transp domain-containing protein [Aphelenchoides fujianensis]|nr:Ammonium-transp domain-containing protein [Aphelenchoides fujianensis]
MTLLQRRQFSFVTFVFQIIFSVLYAYYVRYDHSHMPHGNGSEIYVNTDYPMFQDIHVMVVVGFGFLMSFLKKYGFSAISINLLLTSFIMQYVIILRGFLSQEFVTTGKFTISINELIQADLSCVAVLITMGVLLGRLTPIQFLILGFIEVSISTILEHVLFNVLHINDGGRSLVIHCFGAYFGLTVAKVNERRTIVELDSEDGNLEHSELFSMIGTLFLWIFFPSFNGATQVTEDARYRAIMNTYLAMGSCTLVAFMLSSMSDQLGRFNMLHIQSSTLSGGVAVATVANVILYPHHAIIVGAIAAFISVLGHPKILERKCQLYDTCGVHNLHGLPSLLSGFLSVYFVLHYDPAEYAENLFTIYPYWKGGPREGADRDAVEQAIFQLLGIVLTLFVSILGGALTGYVINFSLLSKVKTELPRFEDANFYTNAKFSVLGRPVTLQPDPPIYNPLVQTARVDLTVGMKFEHEMSYF